MVCLEHSSRVHFLCKNLQGELLGGNIKKREEKTLRPTLYQGGDLLLARVLLLGR
jgi:hypothetical protein